MKAVFKNVKSTLGHLTEGKEYEITRLDIKGACGQSFWINDDDDYHILCNEKGCAHLGGKGDWKIIKDND